MNQKDERLCRSLVFSVWAGNTPKKSPTEGSVGEGSHLGKGEGKFGKTVLAGDGDVLFVGVEDGFDNVEPQTHPVLVGGAGGVGLVEPVKDMGELLGGMVSPWLPMAI